MANGFKEKRISNWQALCEDFETYPTKPAWVFRGQRCESWGLKAGIERQRCLFNVKREDLPEYEWKIVREFRRRAHIYISNPPDDDDTVEWLALLQHHGGPTRLLDFTYSPFVATFFALEEADGDAAVWAIDIDWFHGRAAELVGLKKGGRIFHRFHSARDGDSFRKVFWLPPRCRFVAGVQPMRLNQRLAAQQGTFLCQGDITVSFDENVQFAGDTSEKVKKIVIPRVCRTKILGRLRKMNIERTTLFPGLDGFTRSLNTRLKEIGEMRVVGQHW